MMTFNEVVLTLRDSNSETVSALRRALEAGDVSPVRPGPGREAAGTLRGTFKVREKTSEAAGITRFGFDGALRGLERLDQEELVLVYHFSGNADVFTLFIREADRSLIGCIQVDRRSRTGSNSSDPTGD
jgi:hypothetical protein